MRDDIQQAIIVRKDLGMSKGKLASQCAHAGEVFMRDIVADMVLDDFMEETETPRESEPFSEAEDAWIHGKCLPSRVLLWAEDEEHLKTLEQAAEKLGIYHRTLEDQGRTAFHGVPTVTTLIVGPALKTEIQVVTQNLKLI